MDKLTAKQKRFCDEYLKDLNATQAAIRAGYSEKTAKQIGQENLTKPYLKNYIEERMKQKESELMRLMKTEQCESRPLKKKCQRLWKSLQSYLMQIRQRNCWVRRTAYLQKRLTLMPI